MNWKPLHKRVVVRRDPADKVTPGGIVIPDMVRERPSIGTIVAAASDTYLSAGARVLFMEFAGRRLDDEHEILDECDVLAVIT